MKNRLAWFLAPAVLGAFLYLYPQSAVAQQPSTTPPDLGQQGEFEGEHVDTGAAALDTGPEAAEAPEAGEATEATESVKLSPSTVGSIVTGAAASRPSGATVQGAGSTQGLNVEGDFDLQEIAGAGAPEAN
jgi:hypothetical protein